MKECNNSCPGCCTNNLPEESKKDSLWNQAAVLSLIKEWKDSCGISEVHVIPISTYGAGTTLNIGTTNVGCMMGRDGETYEKYFKLIQKASPQIEKIFLRKDYRVL